MKEEFVFLWNSERQPYPLQKKKKKQQLFLLLLFLYLHSITWAAWPVRVAKYFEQDFQFHWGKCKHSTPNKSHGNVHVHHLRSYKKLQFACAMSCSISIRWMYASTGLGFKFSPVLAPLAYFTRLKFPDFTLLFLFILLLFSFTFLGVYSLPNTVLLPLL